MLRRTPFKRKAPTWPAKPDRSAEFASWTPRPRPVAALLKPSDAPVKAAPKEREPVRDEGYRRLVAAMPCAHCRIGGASQCAHPNAGKAKSKKACDLLTFPLCHEGANGCHRAWDEYRLGGRDAQAELEPIYAARTRLRLIVDAQDDPKTRRVLERVGILKEPQPA